MSVKKYCLIVRSGGGNSRVVEHATHLLCMDAFACHGADDSQWLVRVIGAFTVVYSLYNVVRSCTQYQQHVCGCGRSEEVRTDFPKLEYGIDRSLEAVRDAYTAFAFSKTAVSSSHTSEAKEHLNHILESTALLLEGEE